MKINILNDKIEYLGSNIDKKVFKDKKESYINEKMANSVHSKSR